MILSKHDLDQLIARARIYMLVGFAAVASEWLIGIGAVSAVFLISLGALLACFEDYRTEPGLWMPALLFGGLFSAMGFLNQYGAVSDAVRGVQAPWPVVLDMSVAIHFQWLMVRAAAAVVIYNRHLTSVWPSSSTGRTGSGNDS